MFPGLRHLTVSSCHHKNTAVHLASSHYHVLYIISVTGTVNVRVVPGKAGNCEVVLNLNRGEMLWSLNVHTNVQNGMNLSWACNIEYFLAVNTYVGRVCMVDIFLTRKQQNKL